MGIRANIGRRQAIACAAAAAAAAAAACVAMSTGQYDGPEDPGGRESAADRQEAAAREAGTPAGMPVEGPDWKALHEWNEDIVAWLQIDGTGIDEQVMRSDGDYRYLDHDADGEWSSVGSLVMDEYCQNPESQHLVIYGHHYGGTVAFSELFECYEQDDFDTLGCLTLDLEGSGRHVMAPLCAASVDKSYRLVRQFDFVTVDDFRAWLQDIAAEADVRAGGWDELCRSARRAVTCATCSSHWSGQPWRTIVTFVEPDAAGGD